MFEISCPSCGTPVRYRRESSVYATCPSCNSIMVRKDANVELLGKAADLQPDNTPLQVGTTGAFNGNQFEVLGRIQIRQEEGFWNEWYLGFANGQSGWLGEALGEYFLSFETKAKKLPRFEDVSLNDEITINHTKYFATNIGHSVVVSYEGELPFIMTGSYQLPYIDLRSQSKKAATLDYSDGGEQPLFFEGVYAEFDELNFHNLRDPEDNIERRSAQFVSTISCPTCGAPHNLSSAGVQSQVWVCEYCETALDISNSANCKVLWEAKKRQKKLVQPIIPLGTKGTFRGVEWEVIGYQRKYSKDGNTKYYWHECLCYERCHGYRYLVMSQGHWSWCNTVHEVPRGSKDLQSPKVLRGHIFKHYEGYIGHVDCVAGEFPYHVDLSTTSDIQDYVSPPFGLSRERDLTTNNPEVYWSIADYVEPEEVQTAFHIEGKLPNRYNVGAFQPNGYKQKIWPAMLVFLVSTVALLSFCAFMAGRAKVVCREQFAICRNTEPSVLTDEFKVEDRTQAVRIDIQTNLQNRWLYFDLALVNTETQEATLFSKSLSYYSGYEDGEKWSEGSQNDSVTVPRVKPGTYVLRLDPQTGTKDLPEELLPPPGLSAEKEKGLDHSTLCGVKIEVTTSPPNWAWAIILALFGMCPVPFWYMYQYYSTETERWANSEHCDDDDDD